MFEIETVSLADKISELESMLDSKVFCLRTESFLKLELNRLYDLINKIVKWEVLM